MKREGKKRETVEGKRKKRKVEFKLKKGEIKANMCKCERQKKVCGMSKYWHIFTAEKYVFWGEGMVFGPIFS